MDNNKRLNKMLQRKEKRHHTYRDNRQNSNKYLEPKSVEKVIEKTEEKEVVEKTEEEILKEEEQKKQYELAKLQYPLQFTWTMWYGKWNSPSEVLTFDNIADFWSLFNTVKVPSLIPNKLEYHIFRTGTRPNAEEDINKNGGSWIIECKPWDVDKFWLNTVLYTIGHNFQYSDDVVGLVVTCRHQENFGRIQVWVDTCNLEIVKSIGEQWREILPANKYKIRFTSHDDVYIKQVPIPLIVM